MDKTNKEIKDIIKNIQSYANEESCIIILSQEQNKALLNYINILERDNERLNNIINELEKYLIEYSQDLEFTCYANTFLEKLRELKGE